MSGAPTLHGAHPIRSWLWERFTPTPVRSFLMEDERFHRMVRRHWLVPLIKMTSGGGMMVFIGVITFLIPGWTIVQALLMLGALGHAAFVGWCVLGWRVEQIAVTDTRLLRASGIFVTSLDVVPLARITDLSFTQSLWGRLFDYGSFQIETSGQKQYLNQLNFIPSPAEFYRSMLCYSSPEGECDD